MSLGFEMSIPPQGRQRRTGGVVRQSLDGKILIVNGQVLEILVLQTDRRASVGIGTSVFLLQFIGGLAQRLDIEGEVGDKMVQDAFHVADAFGLGEVVASEPASLGAAMR